MLLKRMKNKIIFFRNIIQYRNMYKCNKYFKFESKFNEYRNYRNYRNEECRLSNGHIPNIINSEI